MKFSDNGYVHIKRAALLFLVMLTAAFQHTDGAIPTVFGAKAMVLIPLLIVIGMYERSMTGLAFGVIAGALWDFSVARGDGFFSVALAIIGYFSGVLVTYFLRNNIFSALLLTFTGSMAVNCIYWYVFVYSKGFDASYKLLKSFYLPSVIYTLLFIFLYYYLVRFIVRFTVNPKKEIY